MINIRRISLIFIVALKINVSIVHLKCRKTEYRIASKNRWVHLREILYTFFILLIYRRSSTIIWSIIVIY